MGHLRRRIMSAMGKDKCVVTVTRSDTTDGKYLEFASATADGADISSAGVYLLEKGTIINCFIKNGKNSKTPSVIYDGTTVYSLPFNYGEASGNWEFTLENDITIDFKVNYKSSLYYNNSYGTITIKTA